MEAFYSDFCLHGESLQRHKFVNAKRRYKYEWASNVGACFYLNFVLASTQVKQMRISLIIFRGQSFCKVAMNHKLVRVQFTLVLLDKFGFKHD